MGGLRSGTPGVPVRGRGRGGAGTGAPNENPVDTRDSDFPTARLADRHSAGGRTTTRRPGRRDSQVVLERYTLLELIGHGGFGSVWLARDERLGRHVAVKRIPRHATLAGNRERGRRDPGPRIFREAYAAARLNHPGIVALFEAGEDEDAFYLVSELVRGRTLGELQHSREGVSDAEVVEVGIAMCGALDHAHARGVVHRDVKPHNVIVPEDPAPRPREAKLTDFGVAHLVGEDALTRTGDVVGTLAYMAPEQAEGREVTEASDLYSLALVLYEALSGRNPVRGAGLAATARLMGRRIPPLGRARRDLPPALCHAIDRAVAPRAEQRGTLADLHHALGQARSQVGSVPAARPAGGPGPTPAPRALPHSDRARAELGPEPSRAAEPSGHEAILTPRRRRRRVLEALGWLEQPRPTLAGRAVTGVAGGGLAALALAGFGPGPPLQPAVAAMACALGIALLPRLGWLAVAAGVAVWLAAAGQTGMALLVLAGVAPVPFLLPLAPWLWSAPALAPVMGIAALAGAFPALAGQARTPARRAALGALGFWWLGLAEAAFARNLLLGPAAGTRPPAAWRGSAPDAVTHALAPLVNGRMLAVAGVWAVGAMVLPWVVRGRSAAADVVLASAWSAAVSTGTTWAVRGADQLLGGPAALHPTQRGAVLGAVAGGALAVACAAVRSPHRDAYGLRPHLSAPARVSARPPPRLGDDTLA